MKKEGAQGRSGKLVVGLVVLVLVLGPPSSCGALHITEMTRDRGYGSS